MRHVARAEQLLLPAALAVEHLKALDLARLAGVGDDAHHARGLERAFEHLGGRRAREARRARPQRDLGLAGAHARAHAHAEDAQVIGALQIAKRPAQRLGGTLDLLVGNRARGARHDILAAFIVEAQLEHARRIERRAELDLVAVPPLPLASQTRAHESSRALVPEAGRARKSRNDIVSLRGELSLVAEVLPRSDPLRGRLRPGGGHAARRRLFHLGDARAGERVLLLRQLDSEHVARRTAFDEHGLAALEMRDRLGAESHALDRYDFSHALARSPSFSISMFAIHP